jgi:hypothetical protein
MEAKSPPTADDWGDLDVDPEVEYGYRLFGGKTTDEARPLFIENPMERAAELRFAPAAVVNYYIFCFVDHLLSPEGAGESDMASCFLRLVRDRMSSRAEDLDPIWDRLRPAMASVAERQPFYDADREIYGSFDELLHDIDESRDRHAKGGA